MTGQASPYGESLELKHKRHTIRAITFHGVPHFALPDICDALDLTPAVMDVVNSPDFPPFGKIVCNEEDDPEIAGAPGEVWMLSPVGVYYFTSLTDPQAGQSVAAWAKRECGRLCPDPVPDDPAVFLTIWERDGYEQFPPYPWKFSGRRSEYQYLKDSGVWWDARTHNIATQSRLREEAYRQRMVALHGSDWKPQEPFRRNISGRGAPPYAPGAYQGPVSQAVKDALLAEAEELLKEASARQRQRDTIRSQAA